MRDAKLIIFDFDGTLVHFPYEHIYSQAEQVISSLGIEVPPRSQIERAFGAFDFFNLVEQELKPSFSKALSEALHWSLYPKVDVFKHTISSLERLSSAGYTIALATARDTPLVEFQKQIAHTNLLDYFSHLSLRASTTAEWTDKRQQIIDTCAVVGIKPEEAIMVGDIPTDIESGKLAGVRATVAVRSGGIFESVLQSSSPDLLLDNIGEFTDYILKDNDAEKV